MSHRVTNRLQELCAITARKNQAREQAATTHQEFVPSRLNFNQRTGEYCRAQLQLANFKPGNKYEFIMNGGPALKSALMSVCQSVWRYEKLPESWTETTLVQLYKGKGPRNNLENMRHILKILKILWPHSSQRDEIGD